jgi:hypothetical protein
MKRDPRFWLAELNLSSKHEKKWRSRAREVIKVYRDEQDTGDARFNILWSNTQTQRPALYSSTPKPVVKRRHGERIGRELALGLERALNYSLDPGGAYDFDRIGQKLILDYLLPGRMVARVKYHPIITSSLSFTEENGELEMEEDDSGAFTRDTKFDDELVDEEVRVYHIPWDQYRQAVVNNWDDMWWVGYGNNFLTREEIIDQFGSDHKNVPLTHISHLETKDGESSDEPEKRMVQRAQVWEFWDREERKIYGVVEGYDKFLFEADDELKLRGFFPSPEPCNIVETPDSLVPIPEYTLYQYQAEEINQCTRRIDNLVDAMKLAGLYPGSQKDIIKELLSSKENTLIPVEDWGAITERGGLQGMIEWIPLRDVSDAWQRLVLHRKMLIQDVFELTGISDIQRGATDPRETKGAQQMKAGFATRRLLPKQQDTQRFFRDLFRIQAEIIAEHFQPETIARMAQIDANQPGFQQSVQLMRDDALRSFTIDIETDSTIAADEQLDKQGAAEFVAALSSYLAQIFPIIQAQPAAIEPLGKMLLWITRKFRIARDAEDEVEEFLQSFQQMPQQQDQEGQAKAQAAQAEAQMKAQAQQAELAIKQQESQAEIQRKNLETQSLIARENAKAELENKKLALDIAEKETKIRLMRDEAEAKVILKAVETEARTANQQLNKSSEGAQQLRMSQIPTKRKVKFNRDEEGRISGAEME